MSEAYENALLIVASIRSALKNGAKHYNASGRLLTTEKEILHCMRYHGRVTVDEREVISVTTPEAELIAVREQYSAEKFDK